MEIEIVSLCAVEMCRQAKLFDFAQKTFPQGIGKQWLRVFGACFSATLELYIFPTVFFRNSNSNPQKSVRLSTQKENFLAQKRKSKIFSSISGVSKCISAQDTNLCDEHERKQFFPLSLDQFNLFPLFHTYFIDIRHVCPYLCCCFRFFISFVHPALLLTTRE
jgi:hypothetical protein